MTTTASQGQRRLDRVVRIAWEQVEKHGLVVDWDSALPPTTLALYAYSRALEAGIILLHSRLRALPQQEAEAILHEAGHHCTISAIGVPGDCSVDYLANVLRRGERAASQWAAEQAIPFRELEAVSADLRDSYDVADYFECSHRFALTALKIYRGPYLGKQGAVREDLIRLFARVEREKA